MHSFQDDTNTKARLLRTIFICLLMHHKDTTTDDYSAPKFHLYCHLQFTIQKCSDPLVLQQVSIPGDLKEDTADAPDVHLEAVVSVGEEALGGPVPAGGDVLGVRRLGVHTPAGAEVSQLQGVLLQQEGGCTTNEVGGPT